MPYCAKCGVEVDSKVQHCPLCQFPIPNIEDSPDELQDEVFPKAQNINRERVAVIKNRVFFTIILLLWVTIPILMILSSYIPSIKGTVHYAVIVILSAFFYLFFTFGYLKLNYNILGISLTSIALMYVLDNGDGSITWFYDIALSFIMLATVLAYCYTYLYKKSKRRNQFIFIPTYILSASGLLCVGLEAIISYAIKDQIHLTWSLIVLVSTFGICLILLGLYYGLPDRVRIEIKKKLHV